MNQTSPTALPTSAELAPLSTSAVRQCDTRAGLDAIRAQDVELVIWQRALAPEVTSWIDHVEPEDLPHLRVLVRPEDLRDALAHELASNPIVEAPHWEVLVEDMEGLVKTFASVTYSEFVDVRLERIEGDACWKFHRDSVEARLVTTYRGSATQWVPVTHSDDALEEQRDYEGPLEQLGRDDVALFKGNCAGENQGIVHRSPPIAGTGETRLLLCLNQETVVSPSIWDKPC